MVDIIHKIGITAPLAKVQAAVSTVDGVAGWWTRNTTGSGKKMNVRFLHAGGQEIGQMDFEVIRADPTKVEWRILAGPPEWIGTTVTFELSQDRDMTILLFGHRGWKEAVEFMAHCSMKWAVFLLSLRQFVETGTGRPAPEDLKIDNWN